MITFQHVYFDSNALRDGDWPVGNNKLRNVCILAVRHGIKVFIPEPVEREMEEQWHRIYTTVQKRLEDEIAGFNRQTRRVAPQVAVPEFSTQQYLREKYQSAVKALKELGIATSSFTARPLREIFEMSVCRITPFTTDKDKHFQDVAIYLSVYDHLKASGCKGALVSKDAIFSGESFAGLARSGIEIFKDLEELEKALASEEKRQRWSDYKKQSAKMRSVLETMRPKIEAFVNGTVNFVSSDLTLFGSVVEFWGARDPNVTKVSLPWETKEGQRFAFDFDVEVGLKGVVEKFDFGSPQPLRIGKQPDVDAQNLIAHFLSGYAKEPASNKRTIRISANAQQVNGEFQDINFEFAQLVTGLGLAAFANTRETLARAIDKLPIIAPPINSRPDITPDPSTATP